MKRLLDHLTQTRARFVLVSDIPPVATVEEGQVFRVECVDWTGGQIKDNDCSDDVKNVDLSQVHYLSGPIAIETAEPGDLLKVEILNLGCLDGDEWGFTGSFAKEHGGGFLTEHFPKATKAIWDIEGIYCTSRHIPGVRFAGLIHPGLIGTAPSKELLAMWNEREGALVAKEGTPEEPTLCGCLHTRPLACLPEPKGAMLGKLGHFKQKVSFKLLTIVSLLDCTILTLTPTHQITAARTRRMGQSRFRSSPHSPWS